MMPSNNNQNQKDLSIMADKNGSASVSTSSSGSFNLETPQFDGQRFAGKTSSKIDLNMLLNSGVPNTAEIIQKCLSVNPFDLKFREANSNLQQNTLDQTGNVGRPFLGTSSAGLSNVLKFPAFSQSPEVMTNLGALTADLETEIRKKFNGLCPPDKQLPSSISTSFAECEAAPTTADVLNAVLDMGGGRTTNVSSSTTPTTMNPSQIPADGSNSITSTVPPYQLQLNNLKRELSSSPECLNASEIPSTTGGGGEYNNSNHGRLSSYNVNTSVSQSASHPLSYQQRQQQLTPHGGSYQPFPQSHMTTPSPLPRENSEEFSTSSETEGDEGDNSLAGENPPQNQQKGGGTTKKGKADKNALDSQVVSSTKNRGGRRPMSTEIPPDERRVTILERNKAAAVRYRKRKKEEHEDMVNKVHRLEQEKCALETQNCVLRRELERLSSLLQIRDTTSRCTSCGRAPVSLAGGSLMSTNHFPD